MAILWAFEDMFETSRKEEPSLVRIVAIYSRIEENWIELMRN